MTVRTADGTRDMVVDALDSAGLQNVEVVRLERDAVPATAADSSQIYFMKPLDARTLYIQYNSCQQDPTLSMEDFAEQVRQSIEQNGYDRVIVDLRNNGGGSDGVIMPLYYLLAEKHEQDGVALYTLIEDSTFSSALINAVEFKAAGATLVGTLATALGRDYAAQTGQGIQTQQPPFADVSVFHYAAPYIGWAQAAGLLYGDSNEVFAPDRAVTRAELAAVLTRYAALCG